MLKFEHLFENVHLNCTPGHLPFKISKYAPLDRLAG